MNTKVNNVQAGWNWLLQHWLDLLVIPAVTALLILVARVAIKHPDNGSDWLMVYLTAVYALLTFYLALAAVKSARASERSAKAMEESLMEARLTRWAQFGAGIALSNEETYIENTDGTVSLTLINIYRQPILDLRAAMWITETNSSGEREVKYSSMLRSKPRLISADETSVEILLEPSDEADSERQRIGEIALARFRELHNRMPNHTLFIIWFNHRADTLPAMYVYDLQQNSKFMRVREERTKKALDS